MLSGRIRCAFRDPGSRPWLSPPARGGVGLAEGTHVGTTVKANPEPAIIAAPPSRLMDEPWTREPSPILSDRRNAAGAARPGPAGPPQKTPERAACQGREASVDCHNPIWMGPLAGEDEPVHAEDVTHTPPEISVLYTDQADFPMDGMVQAAWRGAAERLRRLLNEDTYDRWIAGIVPLAIDGSTFRLGVSNEIFSEWLTNNYNDVICSALEQVTGKVYRLAFEAGHDMPCAEAEPAAAPGAAPDMERREPPPLQYSRRFTFETFIVGENSKFAHAACVAVSHSPGKSYNPLFIHGGTGLGKTHLLQAIAQDILARRKRSRVEYLTSEEFSNRYIDALMNRSLPKFRRIYRNVDVLLIDDVHFFKGKEQFQEEFFHTFNALYNAHKQIVLTSDRPPHEIQGLEKRLVSRFEWGLTTEISSPDLETRMAILRKKQVEHAIKLDDDVLYFIASRVKSNIRRLEGALIRLVSCGSLTGEVVTREQAEGLLRPVLDEEASDAITIEKIQRTVVEHYDLRLADMTSRKRPQNIAFPRQVAMYLCRRLTDYSSPTIAESFNRDHATVLHAVAAVEQRQSADGELRQTLGILERKIKG